jgi:hypothetical protein
VKPPICISFADLVTTFQKAVREQVTSMHMNSLIIMSHLGEASDLLLPYAGIVLQAEAVPLQLVSHLLHTAAGLHTNLKVKQ